MQLNIVSRIFWHLSSHEIKTDSIKVLRSKYLCIKKGGKQRIFAFLRVSLNNQGGEQDFAASVRYAVQNQRMRGLFEGLRKSRIPYLYIAMMYPSETQDEEKLFEFDLVVGTWVDGKTNEFESSISEIEQRASILSASLSVAFPESNVRMLTKNELLSFVCSVLIPGHQELPQKVSSTIASPVNDFAVSPPTRSVERSVPEFYVPNAAESSGQIVLGREISSGHENIFRIRLEDIKRHAIILGMTGSGKTTTAKTIIKQVAQIGLPLLVLDWHNEYKECIKDVGGKIFSPGTDEFCINPLERYSTDLTEHVAIITDIFSDVYHFTHPQAYMFRNSIQKCIESDEETPTLRDLVEMIESYPLRSAYDNETKLALLRRLVPLTQGQAGKALSGKSTVSLDGLISSVACIELGNMRDTQTRSIFSDIILKMVYEFRIRKQAELEHLTVIEEARNIAPARRNEDPPSIGERMISELRKFGESMLFIAQFPSQLASEIIKNSNVRIIHRIAWHEDLEAISNSLGLGKEQKDYIGLLSEGQAVVSLSRLPRPVLVKVEEADSHENRSLNLSSLE